MNKTLEAALESFVGRRTAQGDPLRHRFAVLPSPREPHYLLPLGNKRTTLAGFRIYTPYALAARVRRGLLAQHVKQVGAVGRCTRYTLANRWGSQPWSRT